MILQSLYAKVCVRRSNFFSRLFLLIQYCVHTSIYHWSITSLSLCLSLSLSLPLFPSPFPSLSLPLVTSIFDRKCNIKKRLRPRIDSNTSKDKLYSNIVPIETSWMDGWNEIWNAWSTLKWHAIMSIATRNCWKIVYISVCMQYPYIRRKSVCVFAGGGMYFCSHAFYSPSLSLSPLHFFSIHQSCFYVFFSLWPRGSSYEIQIQKLQKHHFAKQMQQFCFSLTDRQSKGERIAR